MKKKSRNSLIGRGEKIQIFSNCSWEMLKSQISRRNNCESLFANWSQDKPQNSPVGRRKISWKSLIGRRKKIPNSSGDRDGGGGGGRERKSQNSIALGKNPEIHQPAAWKVSQNFTDKKGLKNPFNMFKMLTCLIC